MEQTFPTPPTVVVIGAGHAGLEAAFAAVRAGARVVLVTLRAGTIGRMPCNPAIGGQAKGHLVREIDALGGVMARVADATSIQFKYLNTRKGLAVRSSRAQVDRHLYQRAMRALVREAVDLQLVEGEAVGFGLGPRGIESVCLADGSSIACRAAVVTAGTFLRGELHTGSHRRAGGGNGAPAARGLSAALEAAGHPVVRFKTGTVPRLDGRTIHWERLRPQEGDHPGGRFSFVGPPSALPQVRCHVTQTSERGHDIVRSGLRHSPLYGENATIDGVGPRYCPSIEDKIVRFADKASHRLFLEPEGLATFEVYPNGLSTSLPVAVQLELLRSIEGLQDVRVVRPGYAIEYDTIDSRQLDPGLQSRLLPGLFLAGQINGTTGYEEAAAQGLLAGLNAARLVQDCPAVVLRRDQAYAGVLVDDLTSRGTTEPYRMFTSRAEWRLLLREDNADLRLTPLGRELGLVDDLRWAAFESRRDAIAAGRAWAETTVLAPLGPADRWLAEIGQAPLRKPTPLADLLQRPELDLEALVAGASLSPPPLEPDEQEQVLIACRYAGYLRRQSREVGRQRELEGRRVPPDLDYASLSGLRSELVEKLAAVRPPTVGAAARIPGMTPAALNLLAAWAARPEVPRR